MQALFVQFQHSSQSALPPDHLREALARCYQEQHRFQLGIMDDAAECFEKILEQIHFHLTGSDDLDSCSAAHCLSHQKCSLSVLEMTECQCGETSEPLAFVQFVHYISAPSLGAAAKKEKKQGGGYSLGDGEMFGRLVRVVSGEGEWRECETCHKKSPVKKMLLNNPDLVCIGMIWDSDQPNIDDIMSVVQSVGIFVRVSDIFHRVMSEAGSKEYCLSGMVAYYGHHYCTFCYHTVLRQWGFFDDANFRTVSMFCFFQLCLFVIQTVRL
ncbi:Inactive ubiquitin carboxyl-terminal hydrolase 54 [Geodia barretti]|uniref:Inactive ubiquitin carboxyl-terminal hydrolase 54 n=1 Tax=Geodia barretti TaxID=519541 RepID=A0AA35TU27_GEOBA|nr:Inactive ubiquitin carboxyl-terminal hydrolase 54 [Geodia barretti]